MSHSSLHIANAFLSLSEPDKGDIISNLKIQKLLYYVQGYHLALYGERIFNEDIYAWQYGPVVQEVYHEFKQFGSNAIPVPADFDFDTFNENQLDLITEVNSLYGQYSAVKLMEMTHNETPWQNTPINEIISDDLLREYFSNYITVEE